MNKITGAIWVLIGIALGILITLGVLRDFNNGQRLKNVELGQQQIVQFLNNGLQKAQQVYQQGR